MYRKLSCEHEEIKEFSNVTMCSNRLIVNKLSVFLPHSPFAPVLETSFPSAAAAHVFCWLLTLVFVLPRLCCTSGAMAAAVSGEELVRRRCSLCRGGASQLDGVAMLVLLLGIVVGGIRAGQRSKFTQRTSQLGLEKSPRLT